jgi:two-component system response regulator FixJ
MNGEAKETIHIVAGDRGTRRALALLASGAGWRSSVYAQLPGDLRRSTACPAECLLLDVPGLAATALDLRRLIANAAILPVIVISSPVDVSTAVEAMKHGVFHFMERPYRAQELLERIEAALAKDVIDRQVIERHADLRRRADSLTARERQVMALVAAGKATKVIAQDLGLSDRTVGMYRAKVMDKMCALSIAHLVRMHLTLAGTRQSTPRQLLNVRFATNPHAMTVLGHESQRA